MLGLMENIKLQSKKVPQHQKAEARQCVSDILATLGCTDGLVFDHDETAFVFS